MITRFPKLAFACTILSFIFTGCREPASELGLENNKDSNHEHPHQHGPGHDHEHDHKGKKNGSHSHAHSHGHRHGDPVYGGKVVSIGHSHHSSGATHYHAEVLPVDGGRISFYMLSEGIDGKPTDAPVKSSEIVGYVDRLDRESSQPMEAVFVRDAVDSTALFSAAIPEYAADAPKLSVVIPMVKLDGQRQTFSFSVENTLSGIEKSKPSGDQELINEKANEEQTSDFGESQDKSGNSSNGESE